MAVVQRGGRRRRMLGDVSPGLQRAYDQIATLQYVYQDAFPNVDFPKYDPVVGGNPAGGRLGDLLKSGEITEAQYVAQFGPVPRITDEPYASDYAKEVAAAKAGEISGQYSIGSAAAMTPDWYLMTYTPLAGFIATRAGGYTQDASGSTVFVDGSNNVVAGAYIPPTAPTQQASTEPPRYLVGGQYFTSQADADAAAAALKNQAAQGGDSGTLATVQPGGTWAPGSQPTPLPDDSGAGTGSGAPSSGAGGVFSDANQDHSMGPTVAPGGADFTTTGGTGGAQAVVSSGGIPTWVLLVGGLAAVAVASRRRH